MTTKNFYLEFVNVITVNTLAATNISVSRENPATIITFPDNENIMNVFGPGDWRLRSIDNEGTISIIHSALGHYHMPLNILNDVILKDVIKIMKMGLNNRIEYHES